MIRPYICIGLEVSNTLEGLVDEEFNSADKGLTNEELAEGTLQVENWQMKQLQVKLWTL